MPIKLVLNKSRVPVKIWTDDVESSALNQLANIANLPFVFKHVSAMPDVHMGIGAAVGSVIATQGAVSPATVGVDLGCGMVATKLKGITATHFEGKLSELRHSIERSIPVGFNSNNEIKQDVKRWAGWASYIDLHPKVQDIKQRAMSQMGSLGGGNHFVELCLDTEGGIWFVLHSGSRNIGKSLAERHIDGAKGLMKKLFIHLPDPDLAYFAQGTDEYKKYLFDLSWAQDYARENRDVMMRKVLKDVSHLLGFIPEAEIQINCHHNFAVMESHYGENVLVTRKGAVRARIGDMGIIPGSMGTRTYIVKGLGNPESFNSCSHGAGRRMSRGEAKRTFTIDDLAKQTEGIECRKDAGVLDEIPGAYKKIEDVMANQSDLVEIVAELRQILCIKG